jgi:hypothetical protein
MLLRDHPILSYKGNRSWPPRWPRRRSNETANLHSEIGILKDVIPSSIEPYDRYFLIIKHRGAEYIGVLLVSDTFRREILWVLVQNRGKTIEEIGNIDLADTL